MHPKELSIRIGETDYVFSALTFLDWEQFATACQFQGYHRAKSVGGTQSQLDKVFLTCAERPPSQAEVDTWAMSLPGMREIFFLSIKRKHPALTRDQVSDLFNLRDDTVRVVSEWVVKNSLPDPAKVEGNGQGVGAAS